MYLNWSLTYRLDDLSLKGHLQVLRRNFLPGQSILKQTQDYLIDGTASKVTERNKCLLTAGSHTHSPMCSLTSSGRWEAAGVQSGKTLPCFAHTLLSWTFLVNTNQSMHSARNTQIVSDLQVRCE